MRDADAAFPERRYHIVVRLFSCACACACAVLVLVSGCRHGETTRRNTGAGRVSAATPTFAVRAPARAPEADEAAQCSQAIERVLATAALPGVPELEARRAETFARAKADPVLFVRAPASKGGTRQGQERRRLVLAASEPVKALFEAYPALQKRRDLAREVLLTDGYLYATWPPFAAALASLVRPEDLFHEPQIYIQRGSHLLRAALRESKAGASYAYSDGPEAGQRVKLFLFDRVAVTPDAFASPLHREVGAVAASLGFEEMRVRHIDEEHVVADLRYGATFVPTLLVARGAALALECEALPGSSRESVLAARRESLRKERLLDRIRSVIRDQVEEGLPFDEPKTEVGQQDGKLRQHWAWAYRFGQSKFDFNDDKYQVFDLKGRPRVPQVCIDFVTDTFERAGGSWYRPRGEPRERIAGRLDFGTLGIDNERSVESFVIFAKQHPEAFDVVELPDEERIPYARRADFFAHLASHKDRYRPGDVVTIYGLRDDGKMHYHSFFVYEADPVTGAPSLVAANAGRPRIRPWEAEMVTAPQRSIRARVRPRLDWLEQVLGDAPVTKGRPEPVHASTI